MDKKTKIIVSVVAAVVVVAIIAVVCVALLGNSGERTAAATVEKLFAALQKGDMEEANKYVRGDLLGSENGAADELFDSKEMTNAMFKGLKCEVISSEKNEDGTYTVKANISNKSFKEVFTNYMTQALSLALSGTFGNATEEDMAKQMTEYFVEAYNSEEVEVATTEIDFIVEKTDDGWRVDGEDEAKFAEALLPGFEEIMNTLASSFATDVEEGVNVDVDETVDVDAE